MRRGGAVLLVAMMAALQAMADEPSEELNTWRSIAFETTTSCMVACLYWLDTLNADVDRDGEEDVRFHTCGSPDGTDGSLSDVPGLPYDEGVVFDQIVVGPRPSGSSVLIAEIYPTVDWDLFVCSENGHDLGWCGGTEECTNVWPQQCQNVFGPNSLVPLGCQERVVISVASESRYILRAYNWSDPLPAQGRYCFASHGSCS